MKDIIKAMLVMLVILGMGASTLNADADKGKRMYLKKLKNTCQMGGLEMATKHTQDEWKKIQEDGVIAAEIKKFCPTVSDKALKEKYLNDYADFFIKFAKGSGNEDAC